MSLGKSGRKTSALRSTSEKNAKIVDDALYGQAVLEDNIKRALTIVPKNILDISGRTLNKANVLTRWSKYLDKIFLSVYWPNEKKGLVFPFGKEDRDFIRLIIEEKSLAVGNPGKDKKLLILDVFKDEPLEWIEEEIF